MAQPCIVVTLFILVCTGVLISTVLWFIFLPNEPKVTISNATLTQFDFTGTDNILHYNLALNFTLRNSNKRVGIDYRSIQVIAAYRKKKLAAVTLSSTTPFYQDHQNTTIMHAVVLQGQQWARFRKRDGSEFNLETAAGFYSIYVQIYLHIRDTGVRVFRKLKDRPLIYCKLNVPSSTFSGTSAGGFNPTECKNVNRKYRRRIR